jgi:membrane associated rhomboid family serine protease
MLVVLAVTLVQFFGPGVAASLPLAALVKPAVREGEWWRLITAALLHANGMHLCANVASLGVLGEFVEVYDRRARVALVFLAGAICGGIASTLAFSATSVGASGGVLGLGGYLLGAGVGPRSAPGWLTRRVKRGLLPTAVLGITGFLFIDNAAHIGGLAAGYAIGLLAKRAARDDNSRLAHALDWAGWLSLALLACMAVFTTGRLLRAW